MAGNQEKRLALDTNLLLDFARGMDVAHELNMDEDGLALAFADADLPAAHPVHPMALLTAMR
jgi:hypothetical protein